MAAGLWAGFEGFLGFQEKNEAKRGGIFSPPREGNKNPGEKSQPSRPWSAANAAPTPGSTSWQTEPPLRVIFI